MYYTCLNSLPVDWSLDWFYWMFGCSCYGRCSACCLLSAVIYIFYSYTWFVWRFYILWLMFTVQTWFEWSLYSSLIGLKYDLSWFLDKPDSANLWSVVTSASFKALVTSFIVFLFFIYYCLYNTNAVNDNTCHLCVSAGYVQPHGLQRRHYVFIMSRCLSRANTDSSAGLASPLHTYYYTTVEASDDWGGTGGKGGDGTGREGREVDTPRFLSGSLPMVCIIQMQWATTRVIFVSLQAMCSRMACSGDIMFLSCPVVCPLPTQTHPQGWRVHYTHTATETSDDFSSLVYSWRSWHFSVFIDNVDVVLQ